MKYLKAKLIKLLVDFFGEDYRRITHALNVLDHSTKIMQIKNNYDEDIVIACALLHIVTGDPVCCLEHVCFHFLDLLHFASAISETGIKP